MTGPATSATARPTTAPTTTTPTTTAAAATGGAAGLPDVVDALEAALNTTGTLFAGIAPTQWSAPTPCPGWDVQALTNHLVGGLRIFTAQLIGTDTGGEHVDDWLGNSPAAAYTAAAAAVLAAWRAPGAMDRTLSISLGEVPAPLGAIIELTEVVVHGLDVAVATGQEDRVDAGEAASLHDRMLGMGMDSYRVPGVFGPAVPAPTDAPAHRQLLAFLGRRLPAAHPQPA
jgi:uncharacterized protein (TIGR03086 family)